MQWAATGRIPALKPELLAGMLDPKTEKAAQLLLEASEIQLYYDQCLEPRLGEMHKSTTQSLIAGTTTPEEAARNMEMLAAEIASMKEKGGRVEFRNLCIRKVEIILVRNLADNAKDEYTVRITAHAQVVAKRNGVEIARQDYVTAFEEYWTFTRPVGNNPWQLSAINQAK